MFTRDVAARPLHHFLRHGMAHELYLHRSCRPLAEIDFAALAPNTLDPLTTEECLGMCGT